MASSYLPGYNYEQFSTKQLPSVHAVVRQVLQDLPCQVVASKSLQTMKTMHGTAQKRTKAISIYYLYIPKNLQKFCHSSPLQ